MIQNTCRFMIPPARSGWKQKTRNCLMHPRKSGDIDNISEIGSAPLFALVPILHTIADWSNSPAAHEIYSKDRRRDSIPSLDTARRGLLPLPTRVRD